MRLSTFYVVGWCESLSQNASHQQSASQSVHPSANQTLTTHILAPLTLHKMLLKPASHTISISQNTKYLCLSQNTHIVPQRRTPNTRGSYPGPQSQFIHKVLLVRKQNALILWSASQTQSASQATPSHIHVHNLSISHTPVATNTHMSKTGQTYTKCFQTSRYTQLNKQIPLCLSTNYQRQANKYCGIVVLRGTLWWSTPTNSSLQSTSKHSQLTQTPLHIRFVWLCEWTWVFEVVRIDSFGACVRLRGVKCWGRTRWRVD